MNIKGQTPLQNSEFSIELSQKTQDEAIKDISLKIKLKFPKSIANLIILFTPEYSASNILKILKLTLKPQQILGLQSPYLIFEDKIIQKGIVACCINKEGVELKEDFLKAENLENAEKFLSSFFKKLKGKDFHFFSFISAKVNSFLFLRSMRLSLGKIFSFLGAGFTNSYSLGDSQIVTNTTGDGLIAFALRGLKVNTFRLGGYLPLGKPFTITKTASQSVIREINGRPAMDVYKRYLEERFKTFLKNKLFRLYPLGIKNKDSLKLIHITDFLDDGSLACVGQVHVGDCGHIMLLDSALLLEDMAKRLKPLVGKGQGLAFIINSLPRKKILKDSAQDEIKLMKQILSDKIKVIGLYSDYHLCSDQQKGDIDIETADALITLWQ